MFLTAVYTGIYDCRWLIIQTGYGIIYVFLIIFNYPLPNRFEMLKLLVSCYMIFVHWCKTNLHVHTLCYKYMGESLGIINLLKCIITLDTLPPIFINPLYSIIISNRWNKIQFNVCLCGCLFIIKNCDDLMMN